MSTRGTKRGREDGGEEEENGEDEATTPTAAAAKKQKGKEAEGSEGDSARESDGEDEGPGYSFIPTKRDITKENETKELAEILHEMDETNFAPVIPDAVTQFYLRKSGLNCTDTRLVRLVSLATQKFVADVATDALNYCKMRRHGQKKPVRGGRDDKLVLTMDDLSSALAEYGVRIRKPPYFM